MLTTGIAASTAARAEDGHFIPVFSYRTGAFAGSGIAQANGFTDYLAMVNERDGGVGGVKIVFEECETGYKTDVGVECYERTKTNGAVHINGNGAANTIVDGGGKLPGAIVDMGAYEYQGGE